MGGLIRQRHKDLCAYISPGDASSKWKRQVSPSEEFLSYVIRSASSDGPLPIRVDKTEHEGQTLRTRINGADSGLVVETSPGASTVSLWDERVWAAGPGASEGGPSPTAGDVICRDPTAAGDVLAEALRVLTGARSARHTTSEGPGESRFDIYVDNPLLEPGERVVANVTFHVGSGWAAPPDPPATGATPREEAAWLSRALQAGDVGTLLTYDVEGGEDGSACCLRLNGTAGDLWVGIGPSLCEVCALGERVVVAAESLRAELARPSSHDDILYGGPFEGRPRAEVLAVLLELAGTLAGATGVFHDETVEGGRMRWISPGLDPFSECTYDLYVRDGRSAPRAVRLANIIVHVNCDATGADWETAGWGVIEDGIAAGESDPPAAEEPSAPAREPYVLVPDRPRPEPPQEATGLSVLLARPIRRRVSRPFLGADPSRCLAGPGMGVRTWEAHQLLLRRLQLSDFSHLLTLIMDEEEEDDQTFALLLDGWGGGFCVSVTEHCSDVCFGGERIWFVPEHNRNKLAHQDMQGDVVYGGPIACRPRTEVFDLLFEVIRLFAGATKAFHDETRPAEKWGMDFSEFDDCSYDIYVRNPNLDPCRREFANMTFHVNCDVGRAWGNPTPAPVAADTPPDDDATWKAWGSCRWALDTFGTLWLAPAAGCASGEAPCLTGSPADAPWHDRRLEIAVVRVLGKVRLGAGCSYLFFGLERCSEMYLTGLDTSRTRDMSGMFGLCPALWHLDASNWDISGVTDMSRMFESCYVLDSLNLSGWDVSGVSDMSLMFYECQALSSLDLFGWNVSRVENMRGMFRDCRSLTSLDLFGWDVSGVSDMSLMFCDCRSLVSLDASGWDTSRVGDMRSMFCDCHSLTSLEASGWDTSQVRNMGGMFQRCTSLASLDVFGWNVSRVENMESMFLICPSLASLDVSTWDVSSVRDMSGMFDGCVSLSSLDMTGWDMSSVEFLREMFSYCDELSEVRLGPSFSFRPCDPSLSPWLASLPNPPATPPYTGKWALEDGQPEMGAEELAETFGPSLAGTWVWARERS